MEFLQLRYFFETAKSESIAKTAEKFMVPASSVSASIKRLEKEFGTTLFDRRSNRIYLNQNGYLFAETLSEIFGKLDEAVTNISEKDVALPEIYILIQARRKWITELIIEYKKAHPKTQFRIFNDIHTIDIGDFDIIVDEQSDKYGHLERFLLCTEQICIKASKNNHLIGKKLSFSQLRDEPFVMPRKAIGIRKLLEETSQKHGFEPNITIECNDSYCLSKYVKANMGLTLGSYRALRTDVESDIMPLDITDFREIQAVYVYHRKASAGKTEVNNFCNFLFEKGKMLSES